MTNSKKYWKYSPMHHAAVAEVIMTNVRLIAMPNFVTKIKKWIFAFSAMNSHVMNRRMKG